MKREDIEKQVPGITKEALDWLMAENGKDIAAEQGKTNTQKAELDKANKTIKDLQTAAAKFEGVDVEALRQQIADAQKKYNDDIAKLHLDNAIDLALEKARARNGKAVRALLDMDKIEYKDGKLSGLDDQLAELQKSQAWAFDGKPGATVSTGAEHQTTTPDDKKGFEDELKAALHLTTTN